MNLGDTIAHELQVEPNEVFLLRHGNSKVDALLAAGATIEEYTCVQPIESRYNYLADGKPAIRVIVVIVKDHVYAAYWLKRADNTIGTTWSLTSRAFQKFDEKLGYKEKAARRFILEEAPTKTKKRLVYGWSSPRHPVARHGDCLFQSVSVY